ncbi:N-acetyltransferase [Corynebacterium sp. 13CS0277]|uniref:GNAT family N-acetyltransferase n=1 Tax=Corynebacterium sp. 13CS0277 TaxID=2071994 RepID=UPI000D03BB28|nr:GNAT family N-acetyltransferase [Corynebacterium sp. 13CS0277]PRQ10959.1 N-acetyltransferase [Corynebacterium sp. 13CS0277]
MTHSQNPTSQMPRHPILARYLIDLPAAEIPPGVPPVPELPTPWALVPADCSSSSSDADLVAEWMQRPHLVETWEQPWPAARWREDWEAKLGTPYAIPLILHREGTPAGYLEIYRPHLDEIRGVYASKPHDLGFHIAIGDPESTGRRLFSPLFGILPELLFAADPECEVLVVEPDYRNERVHRALRREGWVDCGERQQRADRRVRLFLWGRTPEALAGRGEPHDDSTAAEPAPAP